MSPRPWAQHPEPSLSLRWQCHWSPLSLRSSLAPGDTGGHMGTPSSPPPQQMLWVLLVLVLVTVAIAVVLLLRRLRLKSE